MFTTCYPYFIAHMKPRFFTFYLVINYIQGEIMELYYQIFLLRLTAHIYEFVFANVYKFGLNMPSLKLLYSYLGETTRRESK